MTNGLQHDTNRPVKKGIKNKMEKTIMETKTKKPVKKVTTKTTPDLELVHKTISNLTDVVSALQTDVKRIKIRMGI